MSLLAILYWIILILAIIGAFVPATSFPFAPRVNSVCAAILFVLIGLKLFRIPIQ